MLKLYLKKITETANRGDAREESYYPVLADLLNGYCNSINKKNIHITILPKKTEAGNPDFRVWDGKQHITGYIEAKDPAVENLDRIEDTEQLKRYLHTFPNLILTNFLEFRLYRNGILTDKVLAGRPVILNKLKTAPPLEKEPELLQLFEKFFSFSLPKVYNAKSLAIELAKRTRFLKDEVISQELREEEDTGKGFIQGFYEAFKEYLISSLTEDEFSDLYAQTITYGLFAARTRSENGFNRKLAYDNIPQTIGILRDVFQFISLGSLPQQMEWIIDDISEILSVADINKILHQYFHEGKGKDPIIHFYETFLSEYDPKTRQMRGVYYTPEPVVSYIVRSLHNILEEQFNKPDGFADKNVTVLDPAAGTLTFLAETAKLAVDEFVSKYGEGGRKNFIKDHVLKNFYAFELMMAPYAIGHLKMSFLLEELGYRLQKDDRVKLYLTNTLEMEELPETKLPGMSSLSEESHLAGRVKKEQPILVILGNPPYSKSSVNKSYFIEYEMNAYKEDVAEEKNIQPLSDDYIKFIRFAHWKIEQDGKGIIGMITNNSYLSGLIHRGMRKKLIDSFDEIYILNLHGSSRFGEKSPDGSKDENVFDIRQGVAIALFVKREDHSRVCKIFYQDVFGLRDSKYDYLSKSDIHSTKWKVLKPSKPYYFLDEKDFSLQSTYDKFMPITRVFNIFSSGVKTNRDHFLTDFDLKVLERRIQTMQDNKLDDELFRKAYNLTDGNYWNTAREREKVRNNDSWRSQFYKFAYRPFDMRWIYYQPNLIEIGRGGASKDTMRHFFKENIGLISARNSKSSIVNHFYCCDTLMEMKCGESTIQSYLFPLYLYKEKDKPRKRSFGGAMMLFEPEAEYGVKRPNLSAEVVERLTKAYKKTPSPEEIFYYIYAVLYSETYRTKYAEFLKIDFPRVPFTKDYKLFKKMSEYGNRLVNLHLLKSQELDSPIARFQVEGGNRVAKPKYDDNAGRVYINKEQYFEGIAGDVWSYQIGGYQVCDKWLKDRKERILTLDEIQTYCRIVTALKKTIEVQRLIDKLYDEIENAPQIVMSDFQDK
ncbi:MAG: DNA methyltransferase [Nitrospirae bacterium GWC2_46_6]|nr:MAG: DNA methyltransferase [Nitrospirae bacterium GWA2_46_11]OGW23026.1 MAG: DNA methyltransferase [Nitrospirae bacterium GWC2_46_6]OGW25567.1 MAG: DNA methyltransferase [Nitrospirae bacterium GWB2_47_37]HAK88559.1 DNA methyltransferase [Nitrospiraceae bacterium]